MSYCRSSSDNWRSDVYVYADVGGGYTVHTSYRRSVGVENIPQVDWDTEDYDALSAQLQAQNAALATLSTEIINHPEAGKTHNFDTPGEMVAYLLTLREGGFHVPESAVARLRLEQAAIDEGSALPNTYDPTETP